MLFQDRTSAGQLLAQDLATYANRPDVLVLALPRGGVPIAFEIAKALNVVLDVLLVRKLGVPSQQELAMGAIASGDVQIVNQDIVRDFNLSEQTIAKVATQEFQELKRREQLYRGNRPFPELQGKTVILVDDGLATGATMLAAIIAVQKQQPARIVVAVPVAASPAYEQLADKVDEMVCLSTPTPFYSVGQWYERFGQTTDDEVRDLLRKATNRHQPLSLGTLS
ncbi:phosphoribosyltransferase [Nostoc sp. 106C]|jgi:putative phosphoribosyl transferase|uniref:phosphoribosyltransferase n=1 Tax=Nostoc sp. 106C TaxID=1932667 RepID=UPI000A379DB1|nr:phosphoribosyltransferase [Nostoc sp. 106C]OUL17466.1 phosphoribosyl transferase [Nostoc sp. 106C]OUL21369.1 phosphoribosyl transferase [Nostoc sp. RF31YmG]